jgi:hypothetical protein
VADLTPAQELRAAAKLMRERAEAVPRYWRLFGSQIIAVGTDRLDGADVIGDCQVSERAAYVASMHPGVALAVADWLEVYAERFTGWTGPHISAELGSTLAVARAYLGSKEDGDGN